MTGERSLSDYYEAAVLAYTGEAKSVANWMMNDLSRLLNDLGKTADQLLLDPKNLAENIQLVDEGKINASTGKSLLKKVGGGRVAAHEIMVGVPAIRNLIREDKTAQMYSAIQTGQREGMQTLDQCLQDLVKRNLITKGQAKEYAKEKKIFD